MTTFDIDFYLIYLLSKTLVHNIYDTIGLYKKTLYIA